MGEAQQKMAGESLLPKHVELLTPYSATKKPKVRPNYRLLLGLVGVTIILGWLLILTIATFKERKSFAQELLSGNKVERLMESMGKGVDFEPQRDRRSRGQQAQQHDDDDDDDSYDGKLQVVKFLCYVFTRLHSCHP